MRSLFYRKNYKVKFAQNKIVETLKKLDGVTDALSERKKTSQKFSWIEILKFLTKKLFPPLNLLEVLKLKRLIDKEFF